MISYDYPKVDNSCLGSNFNQYNFLFSEENLQISSFDNVLVNSELSLVLVNNSRS